VETNVVSEPLASNGCLFGSTILSFGKCDTVTLMDELQGRTPATGKQGHGYAQN
jgi:hypothetical protein